MNQKKGLLRNMKQRLLAQRSAVMFQKHNSLHKLWSDLKILILLFYQNLSSISDRRCKMNRIKNFLLSLKFTFEYFDYTSF